MTDSIRFIGAVYDPEKLGAYMNESTVYVLAGMGGLSINDAMTYGMPVLCSVCDGTERDLVIDGKNGFFSKRVMRTVWPKRSANCSLLLHYAKDGKRIRTDHS